MSFICLSVNQIMSLTWLQMRFALCLVALLATALSYHYEIEDGVYIATDESLQNLIDTTDFLMVEFCLSHTPLLYSLTLRRCTLVRTLQAAAA